MTAIAFRYAIYRVGYRKPLKRGSIRHSALEDALGQIQRAIQQRVLREHIPLYVRVWEARNPRHVLCRQYDGRQSFRMGRSCPAWRKNWPGYDRVNPHYVFVVISPWGELDVTWLAYEPTKHSLLARKQKRTFGPFSTEGGARKFIAQVEAVTLRGNYAFTQHRRYRGQ